MDQPQNGGYQQSYASNDHSTHPPTSLPISASGYNNNTYAAPTPRFDTVAEVPNFSPFPPVRNAGPNIPPTDDQKEAVLEAAREAVLGCNDPEQQLTWAQDALSYVEISIQNEARVSRTQTARPRTPRAEHVLREDALKVTNFLADQFHPKAQFMRGMWYEFGKFGYPVDKPESFQCYKRASERGYARAWYRMGMQFESGNDVITAIKFYRMASDAGDSAACYRLGMMIILGQHGQPQDFERGLQLIYAAAHTADDNAPQGAYVLGMLQAKELPKVDVPDRYLPQSIQSAKINIERAAFLGFAKAQVRMGSAYELGELNCDFDPALSLHYNALAARQGEVEAEMAISKWFLCGHEDVFEKNEELAFTYAQRAAVDGLPTAQFAVGYFYEVGIYVQSNLQEAKDWYGKAAENGNKDAKKRIEAVSRSKTISRKEHESIALKKIRDQHRESIHQVTMQPLPEVPSPTLDMPDPSKLSLYSQSPQSQQLRAPSAAPYPAGPIPGTSPQLPEFRPTSAFGINPNLRPTSAATFGAARPDPYLTSPPPSQRPYSAAYPEDGYQRRTSAGGLAPQQRQPGRHQSPHISPNLGPRQDSTSPAPRRPSHPQQPSSTSNLNLGFVAPIDSQGADRPNWSPQMSGSGEGPRLHSQQQSQPQQAQRRNDGYPPRASSNLPSQQNPRPPANQGYVPGGNASQQGQSQPRPPMPQQQQQQQTNIQAANFKPSQESSRPADISPTQAPQQVPASQAAAPKPPGKGPKTFAEMGIPDSRAEKDCVSTCIVILSTDLKKLTFLADCYVN